MNITLIGIDLAKNIFQVCGVNQSGKSVFNRPIKRAKLMMFLAQYPNVTIAMEACSGSNYWGRELQQLGHKVMLIPPQHVKPFVKGNKNDRNDAFAITEAARRPGLLCVKPRTLIQTDMIQVHRLRERRVEQRTALINQLRGFLNEYGIVIAQGKAKLFMALPELLDNDENSLTPSARNMFQQIQSEWCELNDAIKQLDKEIKQQAEMNSAATRLLKIKGVAEKTATAAVAHAGDGSVYKNGRHFSANLGLVPKEHSSGGKQNIKGITKRGNQYLRRLFIQGAWSVIRHADMSNDRLSVWAKKLIERRGKQKAVIAVANKMARITWSMLYHQTEYRAA
jgi:transposase